jgi:hypothetical protein
MREKVEEQLRDPIEISKSCVAASCCGVRFMTRVEFEILIQPTIEMPSDLLETTNVASEILRSPCNGILRNSEKVENLETNDYQRCEAVLVRHQELHFEH